MEAPSDQRLVRAARSGDGPAFARLVSRHYPVLLASCQRMLADIDLARDAAQEAALRAMLGLDQLRDDAHFGSWLVGIGINVCRGLLAAGRRQVSLEALRDGGQLAEPAADGDEPVELIAAGELTVRVHEAIAALPAGQRQAVALFYIGGLTQSEAARELGTRPGAIKTRLHKARRSLRASLTDTYQEYIKMTDQTPQLISMRVAELRRTPADEAGVEQHIVFLEDEQARRMPIWIGQAEATAMALILEQVELPRPGVYQFAASLLAGGGGRPREVRVTELTESIFYAQVILSDDTRIDARPSDALTLALVTDVPIYAAASVLERAEKTTRSDLIKEANEAVDDARVIADEAQASRAASMARLASSND
ncbi:MAG TPA: bifunctional nuclease domain-containing protein [Solirubrobacteraceae bacterium]|jgi:RNA polymerase sigma factor (sigma-70 family)